MDVKIGICFYLIKYFKRSHLLFILQGCDARSRTLRWQQPVFLHRRESPSIVGPLISPTNSQTRCIEHADDIASEIGSVQASPRCPGAYFVIPPSLWHPLTKHWRLLDIQFADLRFFTVARPWRNTSNYAPTNERRVPGVRSLCWFPQKRINKWHVLNFWRRNYF